MRRQKGFSLIEILIALVVFIITAVGGTLVWKSRVPQITSPKTTEQTITPFPTADRAKQTIRSVSQFIQRKGEFIGKQISVKGKVVFDTRCPPGAYEQYPKKSVCLNVAYLVDEDAPDATWYLQENGLLLSENNQMINCQTQNSPPSCNGWVHGQEYLIEGFLDYQIAGGKRTNTLILEVKYKKRL